GAATALSNGRSRAGGVVQRAASFSSRGSQTQTCLERGTGVTLVAIAAFASPGLALAIALAGAQFAVVVAYHDLPRVPELWASRPAGAANHVRGAHDQSSGGAIHTFALCR